MRPFKHVDAGSVEECVSLLREQKGKACIIAGGIDVVRRLRNRVDMKPPELLVNIKTITDLDYISADAGTLRIGALARLEQIGRDRIVRSEYKALSDAALSVASWQHRNMITVAGALCQEVRCWYYHYPDNRNNCLRKGGERCHAKEGDTRYLSIFGEVDGCIAANSSDVTPVLIVLGAQVVTDRRTISVEDLFKVSRANQTTVLERDEVIKEIRIQKQANGTKSSFVKFRQRQAIDYPTVNAAACINLEEGVCKSARICMNAVSPVPYRVVAAENVLVGKKIDEGAAEIAGETAVRDAMPLPGNKLQIAKSLVKRAVLGCMQ
jgi:xanthine dehydrogenase YagS FAD-binding subunit